MIAILQCRPLQLTPEGEPVQIPQSCSDDRILLETKGVSMGFSRKYEVDLIVYIDAIAYYQLPYREKYSVREALSAINWKCREKNLHLLLITPGRICTSSPELGVPSSFADISEFNAIVEVSEQNAGYMPELSYGRLKQQPNRLQDYVPNSDALQEVITVCETAESGVQLYYDMASEHLLIKVNPKQLAV